MANFILILVICFINASFADVSVATYNIWNVMFNWNVRKYRIARMIKEQQIDVIGFQEVRSDENTENNQIKELKNLMSQYKWSYYHTANTVSKHERSISKSWQKEGIGILSRYPIISTAVKVLPYTIGPDTNRRILVHAKIKIKEGSILDVIVVHFSYVRQQQCENVAALLEYAQEKKLKNVVALGDFNVYTDFEGPVQLLTADKGSSIGKSCKSHVKQLHRREIHFVDTWTMTDRKRNTGYTFSNMPKPGLVSRPDRILASKNLQISSASVFGDGRHYKAYYTNSITYQRFKSLLYFAYLSSTGTQGYSCLQDCGPEGSCRCGVCVRGGNNNTCILPKCSECNGEIYYTFCIFVFFAGVFLVHLFYSVLNILTTGSNYRRETVFSILGCNCCLCNKNLFRRPNLVGRRNKLFVTCQKWPPFQLPPYMLLFASSISLLLTVLIAQDLLSESLSTIHSIMDEELFPSDHLMLKVNLRIP